MGCANGSSKDTVRPDDVVETCKQNKKKRLVRLRNNMSYQELCQKARDRDWVVYKKIANAPRLDLSINLLWRRRKLRLSLKNL